jgi:hypothetical protein
MTPPQSPTTSSLPPHAGTARSASTCSIGTMPALPTILMPPRSPSPDPPTAMAARSATGTPRWQPAARDNLRRSRRGHERDGYVYVVPRSRSNAATCAGG